MIVVGREYYFEHRDRLTFGRVIERVSSGVLDCFKIIITDPARSTCFDEVIVFDFNVFEDATAAIERAKFQAGHLERILKHWEDTLEELESAPEELDSSARADIEQDLEEAREASA